MPGPVITTLEMVLGLKDVGDNITIGMSSLFIRNFYEDVLFRYYYHHTNTNHFFYLYFNCPFVLNIIASLVNSSDTSVDIVKIFSGNLLMTSGSLRAFWRLSFLKYRLRLQKWRLTVKFSPIYSLPAKYCKLLQILHHSLVYFHVVLELSIISYWLFIWPQLSSITFIVWEWEI